MVFWKTHIRVFLFLAVSSMVFSSESELESESKKINFNASMVLSNARIYQGMNFWKEAFLAFRPEFVFYNKVSVDLDGVHFLKIFEDKSELKLGLSYFHDKEPTLPFVFQIKKGKEDFRNQRPITFSSYLQFEYQMNDFLKFTSMLSQDLKEHFGVYLLGGVSYAPHRAVRIKADIAYGTKGNAKYVYGPEGSEGFGHTDLISIVFLPFLPYDGVLILYGKYSYIMNKSNQNADYVRGKKENLSISVVSHWRF